MDAIKFLKEEDRMCNKYKYSSDHTCSDCPCHSKCNGTDKICISLRKTDPEKYVSIVEKWSAEHPVHPVKTRQREFLKMFPNATLDAMGSLDICPIAIDKNMNCQPATGAKCLACRKNYWLAEMK